MPIIAFYLWRRCWAKRSGWWVNPLIKVLIKRIKFNFFQMKKWNLQELFIEKVTCTFKNIFKTPHSMCLWGNRLMQCLRQKIQDLRFKNIAREILFDTMKLHFDKSFGFAFSKANRCGQSPRSLWIYFFVEILNLLLKFEKSDIKFNKCFSWR